MPSPYSPQPAEVKEIIQETHDVNTYVLSTANEFEFTPGQFNELSLLGFGEVPLSISSSPLKKNTFAHTIRAVGNVTAALGRLKQGSTVGIRGPYGRGWPLQQAKGKGVMIVAGGIGIAPLRPVIEYVLAKPDEFACLEVYYGARTPNDLVYRTTLDEWNAKPGASVFVTVDSVPEGVPWDGDVGLVTNLFGYSQIAVENAIAFTVGPEIMMHFVAHGLITRGLKGDQIFVSLERRMECGIGKCGHCMIGPKYVCLDGPVFSYEEAKAMPHNLVAEVSRFVR